MGRVGENARPPQSVVSEATDEMSDGRDGRTLRDFFGLDGGEFMDTGLTLKEWWATRNLERIANSYVQQDRTEQRRRRELVVKIVLEGTRIREIDMFGSIVVESAVENVMEGDWKGVKEDIEWCTFKGTFVPSRKEDLETLSPETLKEYRERERHYAELWRPFKKLLEIAYAGRPLPGESTKRH